MYPMASEDKIAPQLLVDRQMYILNSRNLHVGAWNVSSQSFIGIRVKFSHIYLSSEYEWDLAGGTAHALKALESAIIPSHISMVEYTHMECMNEKSVKRISPIPSTPIYKHLDDESICEHGNVLLKKNLPLFNFIKPYDDAYKH